MDVDALRALCLSFPGAVETQPFGEGVWVPKVGGKMFAIVGTHGGGPSISLKAEPALVESLQDSYEAIGPGYHLNKRHWVTCAADRLDDALLHDLAEDSYDLVVDGLPRSKRPVRR